MSHLVTDVVVTCSKDIKLNDERYNIPNKCEYCGNEYSNEYIEYEFMIQTKFNTITTQTYAYMCEKCHNSNCLSCSKK